ncbi:MAG TPA: hypothetical protein VFX24_10225 [Ktedonobacterales bacterium]|nr:hypothetical protein [Ktedonobacterales bacterium]
MATSEQSPSAALLRLRAADVVRVCGLNAAAVGLELAANHRVVAGQRDGSRLLATVMDGSPYTVSIEATDDADTIRWACDCTQAGPLACEHVAAVLSAWIAHPSDFLVKGSKNAPEAESKPPTENTGTHPLISDIAPPSLAVPAAETLTLAGVLARMNAADVDVVARRILGTHMSGDTSDTIRAIVAALSDPGHLQALLTQLERPARTLLTMIDLAGGAMTAADIEGLASRIGQPLSAMQSDIAVLERHALLLPKLPSSAPSQHGPGASWRHVAGWRIADEVRRALATSLPLEALPTQHEARQAPLIGPSGAPLRMSRSTPRTLCLALALLAHAPPPLGLPPERTSTGDDTTPPRTGNPLAPGELAPGRLTEIARNAGLEAAAVRLARRLLRQTRAQHPSSPLADIARVPVAERPLVLRDTFRRWLRAESAAELLDLESSDGLHIRYATAHPAFRPATIASEVRDARRFIARLLSYAQPETWYSLEDFTALAWQIHPGLLRGQQHTWATPVWWIESAHERRTLQPDLHDDWMAAEGAFIRLLLTSAFTTWGALDLAAREDGSTAAFRLTPFGAFLLQRTNGPADASLAALCDADWGPPVLPLREGALAVQPLAAGSALLDALALWATPTAVSGKRLIYTLSSDRACAAFDQQRSPASLVTMLRPLHSRAAESVASQLNQWQAEWGHTRLTTGFTLLEASDEAALVEALAAVPEIADRCRRITPTLALAQPSDAELLRTMLARRGYTL